LRVLAYEDLYLAEPKPSKIQRICAVKGQWEAHIPLQFHS
jgi:hypothetical protein